MTSATISGDAGLCFRSADGIRAARMVVSPSSSHCRTLQFLLIILDPADLCRYDMKLLADKRVSHVYHWCVTIRAEPHLVRDCTVHPFNGKGFIQILTYRFWLCHTGVCFHFRRFGRLCFRFFIRCPVCFWKFLTGNAKQFPFHFLNGFRQVCDISIQLFNGFLQLIYRFVLVTYDFV